MKRTILLEIGNSQEQALTCMCTHTYTQVLQIPYTHEKNLTAGENKMPFYTIHGRKTLKMPIAGGFGLWGKYKLVLWPGIKMPTPYDLGLSFCTSLTGFWIRTPDFSCWYKCLSLYSLDTHWRVDHPGWKSLMSYALTLMCLLNESFQV